jgi:uncharacterized protein (TIGR02271 family)
MAIHRIGDFDPDYRNHFEGHDVKGLSLYVGNDKVGSVDDILVDDRGQIRYFIINTGLWILGKRVLLPVGFARIDYQDKRVYADKLTKLQVENLPEFTDDMPIDYDHEERVRGVYRTATMPAATMPQDVSSAFGADSNLSAMTDPTAPIFPVEQGYAEYDPDLLRRQPAAQTTEDRDRYSYEQEPDLYALDDKNHPNLKLYEERLVSSKTRQKTGEAVISKRVETETKQASVAVDKERVVVERMPATSSTPITPGEANFQAGEVSRMEVYEEVPEFHKEAFVREEVRVSKVVDQENATAEEQLRREELDVNVDGRLTVDKNK